MESIGTIIARLRRERGLTQEGLAELIGVTNSTISKWENGTYAPDVSLMPVVADVFGVSIDALYGRGLNDRAIEAEDMYDQGMEALLQLIARLGMHWGDGKTVQQRYDEYAAYAREHPEIRTLTLPGPGVMYLRRATGAMLLKRPEEGWRSLLTDGEAARILTLLADEEFRMALATIIERKISTFTLSSLAKYSGVQDAARVADVLVRCDFARERTLETDGQEVRYFEMVGTHRLFMLFAVLVCAKEFANWQDVCWCHFGSADWYQK